MDFFVGKLISRLRGKGSTSRYFYRGDRPVSKTTSTVIEDLFWSHDGAIVHKWHHYLPLYDRYFGPFRGRPVKMLEIGVSLGGSLAIWRSYFGPEAVLFGIDVNPACAKYDGQSAHVRIGSQADPDFLRRVVAEMGGVDIVLDDGSHRSDHMRASLDTLYPLLTEGGIYIVEDTHACYWRNFGGGYRSRKSFVEVIKTMIDDMHHWYHGQGEHITATAGRLSAIHVYDSMVILEKATVPPPRHSERGRA